MIKTHISLDVLDLDQSVAFYSALFNAKPAKRRPDYANFDLDQPPLKLALNASERSGLSHLGVQVDQSEAVFAEMDRLRGMGLETLTETNTDCCHARQDKVWIQDPDGHSWEVFVVKGDAPVSGQARCGCSD